MEIAPKLPCDTEAEKIVLGALLIQHERSQEIFETLGEDDFFDHRHQIIFRAIRVLWKEGKEADLVGIGRSFDSETVAYAAALTDGVYGKIPLWQHGKTLREMYVRRRLIRACEAIKDAAFDADRNNTPVQEVTDKALEKLAEVAQLCEGDDRGDTHHEAATTFVASIYDEQPRRVLTGIGSLDEFIGGIRPGELVILTADTGVGKTHFARQIARRSCQAGLHCLYASGEMFAEHLMARSLAGEARIPYARLRHPECLQPDEKDDLVLVANRQCRVCRILDGELTLARIRAGARLMKRSGDFGCLLIDYDELIEVRGDDEWDQQRILVRAVKNLALELKIAVVLISQLRKSLQGEDRNRPSLQRLYGSGAKAKHANIVMYLDRPFVQDLQTDETEACVYILKNRDGRIGRVECTFDVRSFQFGEKA